MRVKIKDTWFNVEVDQPILIELTDKDKENIAKMDPNAKKLAYFHENDIRPDEIKKYWMNS